MRKIAVGVVVLIVLGAILVTLYTGARTRAKFHYCRNNLRHLGMRAVANEPILDPEIQGRAFWHQIRVLDHQKIDGKWKKKEIFPDPFVCPVFGKTVSDRENPMAIDYLGPAYDPTQLTPDRAIGADRPGNHPEGGHVVFYDTSVKDNLVDVKLYEGEPGKWLKD